jgi:hypothetical protein
MALSSSRAVIPVTAGRALAMVLLLFGFSLGARNFLAALLVDDLHR